MEKTIIRYTHGYKIHVPNFLEEWFQHGTQENQKQALNIPFNIFVKYLHSVVERCTEINDPVLNGLMTEMALYSIGDPESKVYDVNKAEAIIQHGIKTKTG